MEKLYKHTEKIHNTRSAEVVVPIIMELTSATSVLDIGCGIGTWLKIFNQNFGLTDLIGIDGEYVDPNQLVIESRYFQGANLQKKLDLKRNFDLVLCLEVAEHLPAECADQFVESLCRHSDQIIFSAAIPGQVGQNHINEQWPNYWEALFNKYNFTCYDLIRPQIWNEPSVDVWYRQNIYLYLRDCEQIIPTIEKSVPAVIHPELWDLKIKAINELSEQLNGFDKGHAGIKRSLNALINAFKIKLRF